MMLKGVTRKVQTEGWQQYQQSSWSLMGCPDATHTCPPETAVWFTVWICSEITQDHLFFRQIVPTFSLTFSPFSLQ